MGTVLLVRHAETAWNRAGRVQGWAPTTLTDRGREQARTLATYLAGETVAGEDTAPSAASGTAEEQTLRRQNRVDATGGAEQSRAVPVDRVIASDLRRARETAQVIETATGCPPAFDAGWRERNFGALQGLPAEELFDRHPRLSLKYSGEAAAHNRPEGGETLLETRQRTREAWDRLRVDLAEDETVVVVSHSGPITLLLGELHAETHAEAIFGHQQDNGAVTELRVEGDDVDVVRENSTAHRAGTADG
jgi:probable phosphoglycerate mutase